MNTQYQKGTKLMVELICGKVYEGTFCTGNDSKVTLTNVSEYPSKIKYDTMYNFYKIEIVSITVLEESQEKQVEKSEEPKVLLEEIDNLKTLTHNYKYISVVDNNFYTAIDFLKTCTEFGVFGFGNCFGRNSPLSLLAIITNRQIYLFDIKISGERAFEVGLKEILQSKSILKVVHDSKVLADCLFHVHNTFLENVFDTQVADYMLEEKKHGKFPEKMRKFSDCVHSYLNVPSSVIGNAEISQKQLIERPLNHELKLNAALHAAYLYNLKEILFKKMMKNFNITVSCYMNSMRKEDNAKSMSLLNAEVPKMIKDLNLKL